jgi:serine/threonine-protein kinase
MDRDDDDTRPVRAVPLPDASGPTLKVSPASLRALPRTTLPAPLGPYLLEKRLGIGGMAEVFLARKDGPAGFTKQIVVKRILPHLAEDDRFVQMFLREAQTAASLNHSNLVQVYELGEADGQYFIAMEYVEGLTLYKLAKRAWNRGRSVPMEVALRSIADAALGLHYAHHLIDDYGREFSLVHRDISPDNLMINRQGVTKVLDFGIAKDTSQGGVTKTGELKGKIPYMSPEQIQGGGVDGRSDLYSLGITMYWMLTGKRPFRGATELMTLQGVLTQEAAPPSSINRFVPESVDDICLSLLEKDPEDRFQTGAQLHDALVALAPMRTTESTRFVVEMIEAPDDGPEAAAKPASDGFVPSTPLTTQLGSGERRVIRKLPAGSLKKKRPVLPIAAGITAALFLGGLGLAFVAGGDEGVVDDQRVQVVPADDPLPVEPVATPPEEPPATKTPPDKPKPTTEPVVAAAEDGAGEAKDPPKAEDPAAGEPKEAPAEVKAEAPKERTGTRARRRGKRPPKAEAVATRSVKTRAPSGVRWKTLSGKTLGSGSTTLEVPVTESALMAVHAARGARTRVSIKGNSIDYSKLPRGELSLRIFPFAKVYLGNKLLGQTPLPTVKLVNGKYNVKLVHEKKTVFRDVTIRAGEITRLKVNMNQ